MQLVQNFSKHKKNTNLIYWYFFHRLVFEELVHTIIYMYCLFQCLFVDLFKWPKIFHLYFAWSINQHDIFYPRIIGINDFFICGDYELFARCGIFSLVEDHVETSRFVIYLFFVVGVYSLWNISHIFSFLIPPEM